MLWNDHAMTRVQLGASKLGQLQHPRMVIFLGFSPYFSVFCPLVEALMKVLFASCSTDYCTSTSAVTHQDFIRIFETALTGLPLELDVM